MKKRKNTEILLNMLIILTLVFIWGNSMLSREASSNESSAVMEIIRPVLEVIVGKSNVTEHLVRKLAHFTEYALFGAEVLIRFLLTGRAGRKAAVLAATHALYVAFLDETIQIFAHRGAMVQDMWIDLSGAASGILVAAALRSLILKHRASHSRQKN